MVHVQQSALRALEQQIRAIAVRIVEFTRHVGHHGLEQLRVAHGFVKDRIELHLAIHHVR